MKTRAESMSGYGGETGYGGQQLQQRLDFYAKRGCGRNKLVKLSSRYVNFGTNKGSCGGLGIFGIIRLRRLDLELMARYKHIRPLPTHEDRKCLRELAS